MTLTEIEETLNTLEKRHSGLNEGALVTLLSAGGWEGKQIEEAKLVFRSRSPSVKKEVTTVSIPLPLIPLAPFLPPTPPLDHLLSAHNQVKVARVERSESVEPESLITHTVVTQVFTNEKKREELPHNLPLRPFETSDHVWPFSRYKDIFYGEGNVEKREATKTETIEIKTKYRVPPATQNPVQMPLPRQVSVSEKSIDRSNEKHVEKQQSFAPYRQPSQNTGDEKIVILACIMLLVILLLLGYMYSNGRL